MINVLQVSATRGEELVSVVTEGRLWQNIIVTTSCQKYKGPNEAIRRRIGQFRLENVSLK